MTIETPEKAAEILRLALFGTTEPTGCESLVFCNGDTLVITENDNSDTCICCGEPVPEGRQVCYKCERNTQK